MARKSASQPRRLYVRKGNTIVLFGSRFYAAPKKGSAIVATGLVTCVPLPSDGGRARIQVVQTGADGVAMSPEVWRSHKA